MIRESSFRPAWWLRNPHLQTCFAPLLRGKETRRVGFERSERLELPDGDFIDLTWVGTGVGPVIIVLHGLGGSINSPYARGIAHALRGRGFRAVVMHFRGCSGEPNRKHRAYHSGDTDDFRYLVNVLRERIGTTSLGAVGYSLGGNVLLKYLGEEGQAVQLDAAAAVCAPLVLGICAERLGEGFSRVYQWRLLGGLKRALRAKMRLMSVGLQLGLEPGDLRHIRSLPDFDEKVTAPLHGFRGAVDYYSKSSSRQFLGGIHCPVLVLQARDDPFMKPEQLPDELELTDVVDLEIASAGGHVGFVSGRYPWRPNYWLEEKLPEYFEERLNSKTD